MLIKVKAVPDYILWESTMFSKFGPKWVCLQRGLGFPYDALEEEPFHEEIHEVKVQGTVTDDSFRNVLQQAWQEAFEL